MKKQCIACSKRPALFKYRGKVKADKNHDYCRQCWQSLIDKERARQLHDRQGIQEYSQNA
jgi:hypothetical protein